MGIVDVHAATESAEVIGLWDVTHRRFEAVVADLLPRGAAWNREGVVLQKLVAAQATELSRVDLRGRKLLRELDPAKTFELLAEWETMLGLPDCATPETLEARRAAILAKLLAQTGHDQSLTWWTALVATLGYPLLWIEAGKLALTCTDDVGDVLSDEEWESVWELVVAAGLDEALLQCLVDHNALIETLGTVHVLWQLLDLGDNTKNVRAIASSSKGYTVAAGTQGLLLQASSDNETWTASALSGDDLYAACHAGEQGDVLLLAGDPGVVWRSADDGATWPAATDATAITETVRGLSRSPDLDDVVVAVGTNGATYRSTDAGDTWAGVASPTTDDLNAVARCTGALVACGFDGQVIRSTNGGASWSIVVAQGTYGDLHGVSGWTTTVVAVGLAGTILRSADAGATWGPVTSPTTEDLRAVHRSPSGRWTACGDGGVILQSLDDGETWALRTNDDVNDLFAAGSDWPLGRAVVGGTARTLILE